MMSLFCDTVHNLIKVTVVSLVCSTSVSFAAGLGTGGVATARGSASTRRGDHEAQRGSGAASRRGGEHVDMRGREKAGRRKGEVAGAAIMRGDKQAWPRCGEQAEPRTSEAAGRRAIGAAGRRLCGAASKRGGGAASMRGGEQADGRVDVSARPSILKLLALQRLFLLHAFGFWTSRAAQLVARPPAPISPGLDVLPPVLAHASTKQSGTCCEAIRCMATFLGLGAPT